MNAVADGMARSHVYKNVSFSHVFPAYAIEEADAIPLTRDDVLVVGYPRSGTTWMQYIVDLLYHDDNADPERANKKLVMRVPFLELHHPGGPPLASKILAATPSPRIASSHLHYRFLQKQVNENKVKVIVTMRNPKDCLVSYYHFYRTNRFIMYKGTWDDFFQLYRDGKIMNGDCCDFNAEWLQQKERNNVLIMRYENGIKDREAYIRKVAEFCGRPLSDDLLATILDRSSFEKMQGNPIVDGQMVTYSEPGKKSTFIREGKVGGWKNYFSAEQSDYIDTHLAKIMAEIGVKIDL